MTTALHSRSVPFLCLPAIILMMTAQVQSAENAKKHTGEPDHAGEIHGSTIKRANGGFMALEVVGNKFRLSFFDAQKETVPVPNDIDQASARWNPQQKSGHAFTVLNPTADKMALLGVKFVRPPYNFLVFLTLMNHEGDEVETYTIRLTP